MSVFTILNRIIHEKADPADAKDLMNQGWVTQWRIGRTHRRGTWGVKT